MHTAAGAPDELGMRLRVAWATGAFGVSILMNGVATLTLFYLTTVVHVAPAIAGVLIFASKLYDAVTDPISGWLSDRTQSRWGRRRPYLLAGAVVSPFAFAMLFTVPFTGPFPAAASGTGLLAHGYVLVALLLYTTGYSLFNVPYMAMPAEMTDGYHERSVLHAYRVTAAALGTLAVQALAGFVLESMGKDADAHATMAWIAAVAIGATMLVTAVGTAGAPSRPVSRVRVPVSEQIAGFLRNRPFQIVLGVKLAQLIGISSASGGLVFLLANVFRRPLTLLPAMGLATTLAVFVGSYALVALSKRIGKRGAYVASAALTGTVALSWTFATPDEPLWGFIVRGFAMGIAFAGNVMFAMSMLTDAMELDRLQTGLSREGMYSAFYSFVEKLAGSLGPLIMGTALAAAGFGAAAAGTAASAGAPEQVRLAVLVGIAYVPAGCALLACVLLAFYRLDEVRLAELRAAAAQRATA